MKSWVNMAVKSSFIYGADCPFLEWFCFPEDSLLDISLVMMMMVN